MFCCQTLPKKDAGRKTEKAEEIYKTQFARQSLRPLRQRNALAQTLGENLGTSKILFRALPSK